MTIQIDKIKGTLSHKHKKREIESVLTGEISTHTHPVGQVAPGWVFSDPPAPAPVAVEYGYLYNFYAAGNPDISAAGWHLPERTEFDTLCAFLGGAAVAGGKMKEIGLTHWLTPNTGADNSSGFNARGTGYRTTVTYHIFDAITVIAEYWTATQTTQTPPQVFVRILDCAGTSVQNSNVFKTFGLAIRLVKDITTLTNGQTGIYTGNDGKEYPTICIGTQEWLAADLCETQYRTGAAIVTVTDQTAWEALTTGAKCAYNNDEALVATGGAAATTMDTLTAIVGGVRILGIKILPKAEHDALVAAGTTDPLTIYLLK